MCVGVCGCVLFGPVKPELRVIPTGQKKKKFNSEDLNFPGKELNVTELQSNNFFKQKTKTGHIRIINLFLFCYGFMI